MAKFFASTSPEISEREKRNMERSRKVATQGMVLLENNGALPLAPEGKVALFGNGGRRTVKGGTGSGDVNSRSVVNVEQGLEDAGFEITTKEWLDSYDKMVDEAMAAYGEAMKKAVEQDGVVPIRFIFETVQGTCHSVGEGGMRKDRCRYRSLRIVTELRRRKGQKAGGRGI